MELEPLLSHRTGTAVVAYRGGRAVTAGEFLADANELAARLPGGRHVLNACIDRYRFTVGLAACLISGRVSLLPSTHTAEVVRQLLQFAPDAFCLTDASDCDIELASLPQLVLPTPWQITVATPSGVCTSTSTAMGENVDQEKAMV